MRILLDTHALLWALTDSPKLSKKARQTLTDPEVEQFVSAASAMEIFTKHRLGRLPEAGELEGVLDHLRDGLLAIGTQRSMYAARTRAPVQSCAQYGT